MPAMGQNLTLSPNQPAAPKKMEGRKVRVRDVSSKGNYDRRGPLRGFPEGPSKRAERHGSGDAIRASVNALWRKGTESDPPIHYPIKIQWFAFPVIDPSQSAGCTENGR